jgi:hypothetical protein
MWLTWERRGKCTGFWWESRNERDRLERLTHRWEDGIRMDLKEIGLGGIEWIQLAHDRGWWRAFVNTVMNLRVLVPQS